MSIKKFRQQTQSFVAIICMAMATMPLIAHIEKTSASADETSLEQQDSGFSDIMQGVNTSAEAVRKALNKSWNFARSKKNQELVDLLATALDNFAQLSRDYKELLSATEQRKQSMISLQNTLIGEQAYIDRIGELHNDVLHAQNETQQAYMERDRMRTELEKVQRANNSLRAQIALSESA